MLDKALQQPDGKISDKVLYAEEEVYAIWMEYIKDMHQGCVFEEDLDWWEKHKKH